jgi:hypothetical protein
MEEKKMSYGDVQISNKVFLMVFIFMIIMTGFVVWWAISILETITRSLGWG